MASACQQDQGSLKRTRKSVTSRSYETNFILRTASSWFKTCGFHVDKGVKRKADTTTTIISASSESSPTSNEPKLVKISSSREELEEHPGKRERPDSQEPAKLLENVKLSAQLKYCHEILMEMFSKRHAEYACPFYRSVDISNVGREDYHSAKCPMDLGTIKVSGFGYRESTQPRSKVVWGGEDRSDCVDTLT